MKYIISISGGAGSTIAMHKTIELMLFKRSLDDIEFLFADTNTEDESLYRLLNRIQKIKKINWLDNDGQTIFDVFDKHGIIRTPQGHCKASLELKQKPSLLWIKNNYNPKQCIIISGLDWTEKDRIKRFQDRWYPYKTYHPLASKKNRRSSCDIIGELYSLGYPKQTLYEKGYVHNNCGGTCVLAGLAQWAGVRKDFPDRFNAAKDWEKQFNEKRKAKGQEEYSILKDQRKGTENTLTLEEFEKRLDKNDIKINDFRSGCNCYLNAGKQLTMMDIIEEAL